jgi:hypothetical protein
MITQLQAQLEVAESKAVDIEIIKSRATDIRSRISSAKQSLLNKIGEIREDCSFIHRISENLTNKERNVEAARVTFQEEVIVTNNRFSGPPRLTIAKQTKGNILLKNWEQDITLSKEQAQKVTNSLEEAVNNINGEQLGIEIGGNTEALRQINIDRISLNIKEENERSSTEISKMGRVDPAQIDKHLIQPSAQLGTLELVDIQVNDELPQLARKCYLAKAHCQAEPSQLVTQFVDKCIMYIESMRGQAPGTS